MISYAAARASLAARLSPLAVGHSERVATTAREIARLYGVDPEDARLAGLLHDWHREVPGDELVVRARTLGIPVTDVDVAVPYLLHGPVAGAELAAEFPDLRLEILEAVGAHTYGSPSMSPLAKVVYVADVIEPGRGQTGVEELRALVGACPLQELFARTYAASLHHLLDRRRRIHPQTVATWNDIASGAER